jgi:ectoine hydroxylase-related dioxygenase (phytanoyl-CoA dioxygenase family)
MSDQRIFYSENVNESIRSFGQDPDFLKIAQCLTRRRSELKTTLFNRTKFAEGNKGSGGGWHRDDIYSLGFKSLLYLTDVDEENGPFQYFPRSFYWSHHLRYATKVDQYQYSSEEIERLLLKTTSVKIRTVTAKKGDLVIFNSNGIHRGKPIESGVRCAITSYFT